MEREEELERENVLERDANSIVLREIDGPEENVEEEEEPEENVEEEEDIADRFEYEIEEDVADFVDEEFRPRHSIPESDDEVEEDDFDFKKRRMGKKKDMLELGTKFYTGYHFRQAVLEYALSKGRNIKQDRWVQLL